MCRTEAIGIRPALRSANVEKECVDEIVKDFDVTRDAAMTCHPFMANTADISAVDVSADVFVFRAI